MAFPTRRPEAPPTPLNVGILGATGTVGQKLVSLLSGHPWFRVISLMGSSRSAGLPYEAAVRWLEAEPMPAWARDRNVVAPVPSGDLDLVFSAVDSRVAREVEGVFARAGTPVVTNASPHRLLPSVPLLVPDVNPDHADRIRELAAGSGFIVANPNCSTTGLVLALKPLLDAAPIREVMVTTLQAISGAGYPGVPSLEILGNVIPKIPGEEEKLEVEPLKILGDREDGGFRPAPMAISAQTNRVPVVDGHLLSISVGFSRPVTVEKAVHAIRNYRSPSADLGLPSSPPRPIILHPNGEGPQPRLDSGRGGGMSVTIGRVRPCSVLDLRLVALVHNTVRGAAGGAILNAEFLWAKGFLGGGNGSMGNEARGEAVLSEPEG